MTQTVPDTHIFLKIKKASNSLCHMVTSTVQSAIIAVLNVIINPSVIIIMRDHVQKMLIEKFSYQTQVTHYLSSRLICTRSAD